jgi:CBS domain-containing protein
MIADHILRRKGRETITVDPAATLERAADTLSEHNIGALVVTDHSGAVIGVISERDIVQTISERGSDALNRTVQEVIDEEVPTCTPDDDVKDLMEFVTRERVRHLPVVQNGSVDGVISVGDLLKTRIEEMETEKQVLRDRLLDC